jgi:hypothetical protein
MIGRRYVIPRALTVLWARILYDAILHPRHPRSARDFILINLLLSLN